jgi:hypothetical protein
VGLLGDYERHPLAGRGLSRVAALSISPVMGVHRLPLHLDSSAPASYDFGDPHRRGLAYRIVLVEAGSESP